jgi:hypothetical protein
MLKRFGEFNEGILNRFKIRMLLNKYDIKNYIINSDLTIDVNGSVVFEELELTNYKNEFIERIPFNFNKVEGNFYCAKNNLKSLKGSPKYVGGNYNCSYNNLSTLDGCPVYIGGMLNFKRNSIHNLDVAPKETVNGFYADQNPISDILDHFKYLFHSHSMGNYFDNKIIEMWNSFSPVFYKNGLWYISRYRFYEMYYYLYDRDYEGKFPNFHHTYLENGPEKGGFHYIIVD